MIPEQFRIPDSCGFRLVSVHVVLEQQPHPNTVSTVSAKERRRLKGHGAGFHAEVFGVYGDTCQQGIGFDLMQFYFFVHMLNHFGNEFRCGRSVRLMVNEHRLFDEIGTLAVVVENDDFK